MNFNSDEWLPAHSHLSQTPTCLTSQSKQLHHVYFTMVLQDLNCHTTFTGVLVQWNLWWETDLWWSNMALHFYTFVPVIKDHLSYKTTLCSTARWSLNTVVFYWQKWKSPNISYYKFTSFDSPNTLWCHRYNALCIMLISTQWITLYHFYITFLLDSKKNQMLMCEA